MTSSDNNFADDVASHEETQGEGQPQQRRVLLVDVSAFAHAAWHALPPFVNARGECCRVARGVISRIHHLRQNFEWDQIVCVMDPEGGSLYRLGLYPDYKANRPESDPDFKRQKGELAGHLKALGLNPLLKAGVEADDLLGTIAMREAARGSMVGIVSPDKDILQVVTDNILVIRPIKDSAGNRDFEHYNPQAVFDRLGVWPEQVADWLALQGDVSDNIPGVELVGPGTATKWLQQHGSLDQIIAQAHTFKGARGDNLRAMAQMLPTIKLLTKALLDVPVEEHEWCRGKSTYAAAQKTAQELMLSDHHADWANESASWGVEILSAPQAAPRSRSGWGVKL